MGLIVMLIWVGASHGGPTTIQGFTSLQACKDNIPKVVDNYSKLINIKAVAACVQLDD
jgi:hypothetical protein